MAQISKLQAAADARAERLLKPLPDNVRPPQSAEGPPAAPPEPAAQAPAKRPRGRPRKTEADRLADRERRLAAGSGQPSRRTKPVGVRILIPVDAYKRLTSDAIDMSCSAGDLVLSMVMDRWGRS